MFPNQKRILIQRSTDKEKRDYFKIGNRQLEQAMYNLSPSAFMLYCYFASNADGYVMELYPVNFCSKTGLARSTYDRAFQELRTKGYLIQHKGQKNTYLFVEVSATAKAPDIVCVKDEIDLSGFCLTQNEEDGSSK